MNSLQHILLSTLLVLLIYQLFQNQQLRLELDEVRSLQQDSADVMAKNLAPLTEKVDAIGAVTSKLGKEADAETQKKIDLLQKRLELYGVLNTVNQANALRSDGKGTEAAEKLDSVKKPVWQAGDALKTHKARLQGLMQPIDELINAWQAGNTGAAPDTIRNELETVLGELGK